MDTERLIEQVTKAIMQRLESDPVPAAGGAGAAPAAACEIVTFGNVPAGLFSGGCAVRQGRAPGDIEGSKYIVLTAEAFRAFHGGGVSAGVSLAAEPAGCCAGDGAVVDLTRKRVVNEADLSGAARPGSTVKVCAKAIITALADDYAKSNKIRIVKE